MKNEIPGLRLVGQIQNPYVNGGAALPLYEMAAPKGKPSINTPEGWNALCESQERKHAQYRRAHYEG